MGSRDVFASNLKQKARFVVISRGDDVLPLFYTKKGDVVLLSYDGKNINLYVMDGSLKKIKSQRKIPPTLAASPQLTEKGDIIVFQKDGSVYSLDPVSLKEKVRAKMEPFKMPIKPIYTKGDIVVVHYKRQYDDGTCPGLEKSEAKGSF